jgi:TorA maturation chaperone TorD
MTQSNKDMYREKKMDRQKFSELAHQRSNVYGFLSSIYSHEPDENFIRNLDSSSLHPLRKGETNGDKEFWGQSTEKICEDLAIEYTRLFLGPKNHIPPFESLHNFKKGEPRQMWGTATVEVKRIIESTGLSFRKDYGGIPDHISIELEFMQKLVKNEGELWEKEKNGSQLLKSIKLEKKFVDEHLQVWIPGFCQKVMEAAKYDFYRDVAELTKDFIVTEKEEVENLLSLLTE